MSSGVTAPGMRRDHLPRRRAINLFMEILAWIAAAIAVAILGIVVFSVAKKGASALNLDLLTKDPIQFSLTNAPQGLANAFAGTLVIVGLATLMALPVGILVAIYLNEFAPRSIRNAVTTRAGHPERHSGDRDRDLRPRACSWSGTDRAGPRAPSHLHA